MPNLSFISIHYKQLTNMKIENCLLFYEVNFIGQIEMILDQRYTDPCACATNGGDLWRPQPAISIRALMTQLAKCVYIC